MKVTTLQWMVVNPFRAIACSDGQSCFFYEVETPIKLTLTSCAVWAGLPVRPCCWRRVRIRGSMLNTTDTILWAHPVTAPAYSLRSSFTNCANCAPSWGPIRPSGVYSMPCPASSLPPVHIQSGENFAGFLSQGLLVLSRISQNGSLTIKPRKEVLRHFHKICPAAFIMLFCPHNMPQIITSTFNICGSILIRQDWRASAHERSCKRCMKSHAWSGLLDMDKLHICASPSWVIKKKMPADRIENKEIKIITMSRRRGTLNAVLYSIWLNAWYSSSPDIQCALQLGNFSQKATKAIHEHSLIWRCSQSGLISTVLLLIPLPSCWRAA